MFYRSKNLERTMRAPRLGTVLFALLAWLFITSATDLIPQLISQASANPEIQTLLDEAVELEAFAEKRREQAKRWRDRAQRAQERAKKSRDPHDKKNWQEDAADYEEKAEAAEKDAADAEARAAKVVKEAEKLVEEAAKTDSGKKPPPRIRTKKQDKPKKHPLTVHDVFGYWSQDESDVPFVIVAQDPGFEAYLHRIEAHTEGRVWKGEFEPFDEGDIRRRHDAQLTFTYKPKAEEMNPEVPMWARKAVEGELEWRIELNRAGTYGTPKFEGNWWSGEITWREGKEGREAWVSGKGDPIPLKLSPANDLFIKPNPSPLVVVSVPDGPDPIGQPVEGLIKGQLFIPEVRIPPSLAEKVGEQVSITFTGRSGGDSTTLILPKAGISEYGWVVYSRDPVAIGDTWHEQALGGEVEPPFLSISWITNRRGHRLDLSVENGETVEVKYEGVATSFKIYNSWVQRGLARYREGMEKLSLLYNSTLYDQNLTREEKEVVHQRLLRVKNLAAMLENERLHDYQKVMVAETYLSERAHHMFGFRIGLVYLDDWYLKEYALYEDLDKEFGTHYAAAKGRLSESRQDGRRHRSGWFDGVVWTSAYEMFKADSTLSSASDEKRAEAMSIIPLAFSYTMYDIVVNTADVPGVGGVGDIYIIATGEDHFGKKTSRWSGVKGLFIGKVFEKGIKGLQKRYDKPRLDSKSKLELEMHKALQRKRMKEAKAVPKTAQSKLRELNPATAAGRERPARAARPPGVETFDLELGDSLVQAQRKAKLLEGAGEWYGDTLRMVEDTPVLPPQEFGTCNLQATDWITAKHTGKHNNEMRNIYELAYSGTVDPRRLVTVSDPGSGGRVEEHMLTYGFFDEASEALARLRGAETVVSTRTLPHVRNLTLEDMSTLIDNGFDAKVTIKPRGGGRTGHELHAVLIEKFVRNEKGEITDVEFFDPAYGMIFRVGAGEFNARMTEARGSEGVNKVQLFKWPKHKKPTIEPPREMTASPEYIKRTQPSIEWPKARTQPSIEWPKATAAPDIAPPRASVSKASRPSYVKQLDKTIHEVLEDEYPDPSEMPPFHFTDLESLGEMIKSGKFEMKGGAQFSYEKGIGHYEKGPVVIKVRDGCEQYVEFTRSDEARGLIPHYWPEGIGRGQRNETFIPARYLQWFNPLRPKGDRWVNFEE